MEQDKILWRQLKAGNRDSFEIIFHTYYKDLYRYGVKFTGSPEETEDEIQELFLKLWRNREKLGDVTAVKTYLWTSLRRRLIAAIQKSKKDTSRAESVNRGQIFLLSAEEFIIQDETKREQTEKLQSVIQDLSVRQKEVLYLKFYEGMSYHEIEQILGVSQDTARNYLYLALQNLRKLFPEEAPALFSVLLLLLSQIK